MVNPLLAGLRPTHPGEILKEDVLPALGRSKTDIARLLKISRQSLYDLLEGRQPVTPNLALRIAKLTGSRPEVWLNIQAAYDLRTLMPEMAEVLEDIPTLEAA